MTVFYRGPRALITSDVITVAQVASRSYVLADLSDIYLVRQQGAADPGGTRTMGVSALVGGIIVVPVVGPGSAVLATTAAAVLFVSAFVCLRVGPTAHHELVATYRGRRVTVFASDDEREFGQVCRGLQRALERRH